MVGMKGSGVALPQVTHLGRELLQERTRVKALSEELENPLNVHRCAHAGLTGMRCAE